ncbi:MAG: hypothetical protein M1814_006519 [Vezdaea aestivalis]|nr:MAG: hypothetical protein M1814_006519 [Vezdaea aestivalis]
MANVFDESDNSLIELSQILDFRQVKRVSSARPKQPTAAPMDGKKPGPPQLGRGRRLRKLAPPSSGPLHASFSIQSGKKNALDKRHEPKVAHVEDKNYSKLLRNTKTEVDGSRNTSGTLSMTSLSPRARKFPSSYGDSEVESEDHMSDFIVDDSCDSEWDEDPPSLLRQSPSKKNQLLSSIPSIYPPKRTASGGESAKYLDPRREDKRSSARASTPPSNLPRMIPTLTSPKKLPRIPQSPHRQSSDAFWSQATMNDWNQEYSPKKKLDEAVQSRPASPSKAIGKESAKSMLERKRDFNSKKVALAEEFLKELDCTVAAGQVQELTRTSGGVRIVWSKTLNTTAGRANWKRVALKSSSDQAAANNAIKSKTTYQHIASIELAEKVIDDEGK